MFEVAGGQGGSASGTGRASSSSSTTTGTTSTTANSDDYGGDDKIKFDMSAQVTCYLNRTYYLPTYLSEST